MNKKISISLPKHVYTLAKKKSKFTHGDNFSNYIRDLVCKQFTEEELRRELFEIGKPLWIGRTKVAGLNTICEYCNQQIIPSVTIIYLTDLGTWVHKDCCRKE